MQYENNLRKKKFSVKQDLVFKKPFSKRYIWKKGGRLIIRVFLYLGQYSNIFRICRSFSVNPNFYFVIYYTIIPYFHLSVLTYF